MGVFDDNPFISVKPGVQAAPAAPRADEIARGSFWSLRRRGSAYVLDYLSGELAGRERQVEISESEARSLTTGDDDAASAVLTIHGVG